MSSKANHVKLGLFVITGVLLLLAVLVVLGIGSSLRKPLVLETYLDQSVQGLAVGSTVKYRGVDLGVVHSIQFSRDRYEFGKPMMQQKRYILIEVAVSEDAYAAHGREAFLDLLKAEVARGLRFRLNAQGITGLSFLELDYIDAERNPPLEVTWTPEHPYIPSAPGTLTKLLTSAEQVFRKLEAVDLELVLTNLNRLLTTTEAEVRRADLAKVTEEAGRLLAEVRQSNEALQGILRNPSWKALPETAVATIEDVRRKVESLDLDGVVGRLERTLAAAEGLLAGREGDVAAILSNLRSVTENLRSISEAARAYPAGLLLGAPPKPVHSPP